MKNKTNYMKIITLGGIALLLNFSPSVLSAQNTVPVKNIVIVHGAFADASGWEAVYRILKKDNFNVTLVQNPLTSLDDDVAATNRALAKQDGPVVLVGHSWGGAVITQAGVSPKVSSLVYVAAFVPDINETIADVVQKAPALPVSGILPPDENGLLYFDKSKFRAYFDAEQSIAMAGFMADSQSPIAAKSFVTPVTQAAWKNKPSFAILASEDKSINPELQRVMYKRAGAQVTELKGSHTLFMSQAKAIADVIETAARSYK